MRSKRDYTMRLKDKIIKKKLTVGIIGLGYVGLPLAVRFASAGFEITGIDINEERVRKVNQGRSYVPDVREEEIEKFVNQGRLRATVDYDTLKDLDVLIICVPTPLRKTKDPDISYIVEAVRKIRKYLRKGHIIVLESTTYPGTTRELVLPELESSSLKVGKDFFLAFSPERVDPGNSKYNIKNTPKVVGGITPECTEIVKTLYSQAIDEVIPVSSSEVAEMAKLLENTFRATNIALVNEMAIMSGKLGVDVWEVIDAASTKPFGFIPFYPGPGSGGPCIPIDPHYLSWKLRTLNYNPRFIQLAEEINSSMPSYVVEKISQALNNFKKSIHGSRILILGVAYKKNVGDIREAPALEVINVLLDKGAKLTYSDPYVSELKTTSKVLHSRKLDTQFLRKMDCVIIITDHSSYNFEWIVKNAKLVIDTRNATKDIADSTGKIVKL